MKQKLLLLTAVFFGILAFFLTFKQIQMEKKRLAGRTVELVVLKVTRNLLKDDVLKRGDFKIVKQQFLRKRLIGTNYVRRKEEADVVGRKLQFSVNAGKTLSWSDFALSRAKKSGLAGQIKEGERAISVAVDATSSVTAMIRPGDYVDIIGTFRFPEMKGDKSFDTVTMTILQGVKVLACGNNYKKISSIRNSSARRRARSYSTLTLALSPKEVEMIIFASQKGRLTFSLRNYEETKVEKNTQSVNFKYLEQQIPTYQKERNRRNHNNY
jgi:pilus assembly protein CpaB